MSGHCLHPGKLLMSGQKIPKGYRYCCRHNVPEGQPQKSLWDRLDQTVEVTVGQLLAEALLLGVIGGAVARFVL